MLTPKIEISIGGADASGKIGPRVLSGAITEHDGDHADELHLVLSNHDGRLAKPTTGAELTVSLGFEETGTDKVGVFVIQEVAKIGGLAQFEITGHAADLKKTLKQQKTRSWIDKPLKDALTQIAGDNGLQPAISDKLGATVGKWYQAGESDVHFVTRMAKKFAAVGKIAEGKLVFIERGTGQTASGGSMPAIVVTPNDLEGDFRIVSKERPNRKTVKAKVYDRATGKRTEVSKSGSGDGPDYVFPQLFANKDEAQKAVDGRKREFDRSGKTFSGTFKIGRNDAKAGGVLTSDDFGDDDDMDWTMERVIREFNQKGITVSFECKAKVDDAGGKPGGAASPKKTGGSGGGTPVHEAGAVTAASNVG